MSTQVTESAKPRFYWYQQIWLALPLALIPVGGAIGDACGGMACAFNHKVFRKTEHPVLRYVLTGLVSLAAVVAYIVLGSVFMALIGMVSPWP